MQIVIRFRLVLLCRNQLTIALAVRPEVLVFGQLFKGRAVEGALFTGSVPDTSRGQMLWMDRLVKIVPPALSRGKTARRSAPKTDNQFQ